MSEKYWFKVPESSEQQVMPPLFPAKMHKEKTLPAPGCLRDKNKQHRKVIWDYLSGLFGSKPMMICNDISVAPRLDSTNFIQC